MFVLTHKVRLTVRTARQRRALEQALDVSRAIYNAALEERSGAWSKSRISITKNDQFKSITALAGDDSLAGLPVNLLRWPLVKLDQAFQGFFRRVKAGQTPGYPRFRSKDRYDTFGYTDQQCWKLDLEKRALHLSRIGWFRMTPHRPIEGDMRSLQIKREGRRWYALIGVAVTVSEIHQVPDTIVGLDAGVRHHLTLSTGETLENLRLANRHAGRVRRAQRKVARARKGSKGRRRAKDALGKAKRNEANARNTRAHQISATLTRRFATIVVEDLQLANMVRSARRTNTDPRTNVTQKRGLNRSLLDVAIGDLYSKLDYKAERAGGRVIRVNPRNTSQTCSGCSVIVPKTLSQRRHVCTCGVDLDRDHNAALNVLHKGVVALGDAKLTVAPTCLVNVA